MRTRSDILCRSRLQPQHLAVRTKSTTHHSLAPPITTPSHLHHLEMCYKGTRHPPAYLKCACKLAHCHAVIRTSSIRTSSLDCLRIRVRCEESRPRTVASCDSAHRQRAPPDTRLAPWRKGPALNLGTLYSENLRETPDLRLFALCDTCRRERWAKRGLHASYRATRTSIPAFEKSMRLSESSYHAVAVLIEGVRTDVRRLRGWYSKARSGRPEQCSCRHKMSRCRPRTF